MDTGVQRVTVEIVSPPAEFGLEGRIRPVWQSRVRPPEWTEGEGFRWTIDVPLRDGRWSGSMVGRNSDGRRFLYFVWVNQAGRGFRRIKLYQDQVAGPVVRIAGTMKDGSPACSTARVLE
jgi:hypothetical protein